MSDLVKLDENKKLFEIKSSVSGKLLRTTKKYWMKIVIVKHPALKGKEQYVQDTLDNPDIIKESVGDKQVLLYYKKYKKKYHICAVVRHENGKGFLITSYITDRIKEGTIIHK